MYNSVGYFNHEYYRFGVVFIYYNGTLSNVYNVRGKILNGTSSQSETTLFDTNGVRQFIEVTEDGWIKNNENARGVCYFDKSAQACNEVLGITFNVPNEVKDYLTKYLGVRGLFFVRQKCVPNILGQCYLMPMDEQMEGPVIKLKDTEGNKYYTESFITQGDLKEKFIPIIKLTVSENVGGQIVSNSYDQRLYKYKYDETSSECAISKKAYAAICPDFLLNQPYYNQIFNGSSFRLKKVLKDKELNRNGRFYNSVYKDNEKFIGNSTSIGVKVTINTVTEEVPTIAIKDKVYRLEMGETEEAFKFQFIEYDSGTYNAGDEDWDKINSSTNIVRGKFSPYLAIYSNSALDTDCMYEIYQDSLISTKQEFQNRMDSSDPFYAISDRYNFDGFTNDITCYRGDCYINTFTYRLNRNFNDPSLPNNDVIVDKNTWKDHYKANDPTEWTNISRADLNAVQMGSWITINVRSAMNYALRSEDHSYVSEEALMGAPRSFYPRCQLMWRGENKMPDSYLYNDAYRASLGYKYYFALQDINYIKDTFSNRIQYSAISIQDSFKNNFRFSLSTYFRDYSQEYGSIQKLIGFEGYLLVVFEHAICIAVINERILAGQGDGNPVFINTQNVLPEELTIISDTYGTQWPESVIKSESGAVYGVDTVAKKIWRVKGQQSEILSDFKVNKFLVDNISLDERETSPIIGLKNVKTHYNNNKKDILFTFYDDIYRDEEKAWNLCYNELLDQFITFYSWIPSYSENIDTQFFTFDRNTSKLLALVNKSNYYIDSNTGVLVKNPVINNSTTGLNLVYRIPDQDSKLKYVSQDGIISYYEPTTTNNKEVTNVKFKIEHDHWGNWKYLNGTSFAFSSETYEKDPTNGEYYYINNKYVEISSLDGASQEMYKDYDRYKKIITSTANEIFEQKHVLIFYVTPYIEITNDSNDTSTVTYFPTESIAITHENVIKNRINKTDTSKLAFDFYLHGQAGIFDVMENLYPTFWYGENHPFEFEFVINDKIGQQKIFTDLVIISNKAEPESFHFEIEGDNYEFSSDKRAMYFRQEATKNLYQNLGSNILYDRKFTDVMADDYTYEQYYRGGDNYKYTTKKSDNSEYYNFDRAYPIENKGLVQQVKSTIFPLYYNKVDTYNELYDIYENMVGAGYDFKNLSGSEIKWNRDSNQFNIVTHIKNSPIDLVGRLRGNSRYKEGKWNVQIPSISFMQKNEEKWPEIPANNKILEYGSPLQKGNTVPPIIINSNQVPNDLNNTLIEKDTLPNIYQGKYIRKTVDVENWTYRKETKIRDKWMKVRVRYSGRNLAVIHSIITLYNISYS